MSLCARPSSRSSPARACQRGITGVWNTDSVLTRVAVDKAARRVSAQKRLVPAASQQNAFSLDTLISPFCTLTSIGCRHVQWSHRCSERSDSDKCRRRLDTDHVSCGVDHRPQPSPFPGSRLPRVLSELHASARCSRTTDAEVRTQPAVPYRFRSGRSHCLQQRDDHQSSSPADIRHPWQTWRCNGLRCRRSGTRCA